ncbi:MAG: glucose-1-phosphate adenylyltransferase subunit GlgD [Sarcina sp.]
MNNCVGIINLDEKENRMGDLVKNRPLAAVPVAGRYRVIDFILSNMTNSGIESIGVFTKNRSRSLLDHISNGKPWDLNRKRDGLRIFNFSDKEPSYDDVHAFCENLEFVKLSKKEYVLLAPSYMIANIDFNEVIKEHKNSNRDITLVYKEIKDVKNYVGCDVVNIDENKRVSSIGENIGTGKVANISMEMYLMRTDLFVDIIYKCIKIGQIRKIKNYIKYNTNTLNIGTCKFNGYLKCINSLEAYYKLHKEILDKNIIKELFYNENPIYTKTKDESATKYGMNSIVKNSIIANGSFIEGSVENCVIGRRVYVGENTRLKNCVILQNTKIGDNVYLKNVITDKNATIIDESTLIGDNDIPLIIKKAYKIMD